MGFRETLIASYLIRVLGEFVAERNLGLVTAPDGMVRLWHGHVRIPDVAYVSWDRLPGRRVPDEPIPDLAPDLAIEVLSPSNTAAEMRRKRQDYFGVGVRLVWEVDPRTRTIDVYTSRDEFRTFSGGDVLDGGDVLPGFTLPVADPFAPLDAKG